MKFGKLAVQSVAVPLALLAAIGMMLYVHRVLTPFEREQDILQGVPGNYLGDICQRWIGTRELVLHNRDPYGIEVTHEIQAAYYGHPLSPQEHRDEKRFAYPIFVVFLLAPTIWLPFPIVQYIAVLLLGIATAVSVPLWLRFLGWKLPPTQLAITTILVLVSPAAVQGLRLQQFGLLVGLLIAASAALVIRGRLFWAGSLLAVATIRPQMAALAIVWWLFWAAIRFKQRSRLILGFAATMLLLIGAGEVVLPGWIRSFYEGAMAYRQYSESRSMLELCAGPVLGPALNWLALVGTAIFCWQNREQPIRALSMALVTTILALPIRATAVSNQILELPAILLVLRSWFGNQSNNLSRGIVVALLVIIGWPWPSSVALLFLPGPAKLPFFASYGAPLLLPVALMQKIRSDQASQVATAADSNLRRLAGVQGTSSDW